MAAITRTLTNTSFLRHNSLTTTTINKPSCLFNLKSNSNHRSRGGAIMVGYYMVTLIMPDGTKEFACPEDENILDQGNAENGLDLPYSCKAGSCSSCVAKLVSGHVDQSVGTFLDDDQIAEGWVLTCVALPTCDVVLETHKEDVFNG